MDGNLAMANQLEFNEENPYYKDKAMKTAEEILDKHLKNIDLVLDKDLPTYKNLLDAVEEYHSQFKFYTLKQMEELREHAYQLGKKHAQL